MICTYACQHTWHFHTDIYWPMVLHKTFAKQTHHTWAAGLMERNHTLLILHVSSVPNMLGTRSFVQKVNWHFVSLSIYHPSILIHLHLGFFLFLSLSPREDHVERRQHNLAAECVQLGQWRHLHILPFLERHMCSLFVFASGVEYVCVSVTWIFSFYLMISFWE